MSTTQNDTTSASISDTIQQALQQAGYGSYVSYARPVVEALEAREKEIASQLIDYAIDYDASEEEVRTYIAETGMAVPDPVVEDEEDEEDEPESADTGAIGRVERLLTSLTERIDSLTEFARTNGYRG
jgi:hypothetical protein